MKVRLLLLIIGINLSLVSCGSNEVVNASKVDEDNSFEFHMTDAFDSNFELDIKNRYIMTSKEVEVRGIPDDMAEVNRVLSYQMVNVLAAAYVRDGKWALISFFCFDAAYDNIGWVRVSDLMEYKEDNYQLLRYPVTLKEGSIDLETGEIVELTQVSVDYIDDYAIVRAEGGRSHEVDPDSIIYPPFEK